VWVIEYWPAEVKIGTRSLINLKRDVLETVAEGELRLQLIGESGGYVWFYGKQRHYTVDINAA
jgi:hypothetical protein